MPKNSAKLIVNADDFGLTRAVSDAVITVFKNGSASSASLMATMPAAAYAAEAARSHPALGVGLHFTLTEGFPASRRVPSLTGEGGRFFSRVQLGLRVAAGLVPAGQVREELDAQFERLRDLGIAPSHIDSHQHVHAQPMIFKVVADFARARAIPVRFPHPQAVCRGGAALSARFLYRETKHRLLALLLKGCERYGAGLTTNKSFNSVFDIYPAQKPVAADYKELVDTARAWPHELMVHPYILSEELKEVYGSGAWYERKRGFFSIAEAEYDVLRTFSIRSWLEAGGSGVEMVSYRDLRRCA